MVARSRVFSVGTGHHTGTRRAPVVALVDGLAERAALVHHVADELVGHVGPADVADEVHHHREHLELVRVGVDDRVIDLVADGLELAGRFADVFHPKTSPDCRFSGPDCFWPDSTGLPSKCLINVTALT